MLNSVLASWRSRTSPTASCYATNHVQILDEALAGHAATGGNLPAQAQPASTRRQPAAVPSVRGNSCCAAHAIATFDKPTIVPNMNQKFPA